MNHQAIYNTHPTVVSIDDGKGAMDANGNPVTLDQAKVDAEVARLQAEYDSQEYARLRKAEYPSIEECVHAILDDDLEALQAKRAEIKARYPK
jgi:hypothetical protein